MAQHFTKEQIDEIRSRLASEGKKDSDFESASEVTPEDFLTIVQNRRNKKMPLSVFEDKVFKQLKVIIDDYIYEGGERFTSEEKQKLSSLPTGEELAEILNPIITSLPDDLGDENPLMDQSDVVELLTNALVSYYTKNQMDTQQQQQNDAIQELQQRDVLISESEFAELVENEEVDPTKRYYIYEDEEEEGSSE